MPRPKEKKTAKYQRLQVEMDEQETERMERAKKRTGARTNKQLVLTALRYYYAVSEKVDEGYRVILEKQDGENLHQIEILFI